MTTRKKTISKPNNFLTPEETDTLLGLLENWIQASCEDGTFSFTYIKDIATIAEKIQTFETQEEK